MYIYIYIYIYAHIDAHASRAGFWPELLRLGRCGPPLDARRPSSPARVPAGVYNKCI